MIEMYTRPNCQYCLKAKAFFNHNGIEYTEFAIGDTITKEDIQKRISGMGLSHQVATVPQIFFKNKDDQWVYIGGFNDLISKKDIVLNT